MDQISLSEKRARLEEEINTAKMLLKKNVADLKPTAYLIPDFSKIPVIGDILNNPKKGINNISRITRALVNKDKKSRKLKKNIEALNRGLKILKS